MANNFELYLVNGQSIVSGNAVDFCSGNSSITLTRGGIYNNGISLVSSVWGRVASMSFTSTQTLSSNIGYYDENSNWTSLSSTVTVNQSGNNITITGINMPTGTLQLFAGFDTTADCTLSNLEILDNNGNSLLEAVEPSTGLPLYIGNSNIQAIKLGNVDISKMYIGNTLIYGT